MLTSMTKSFVTQYSSKSVKAYLAWVEGDAESTELHPNKGAPMYTGIPTTELYYKKEIVSLNDRVV